MAAPRHRVLSASPVLGCLAFLAIVPGVVGCRTKRSAPPPRPNVVLLVMDTTRGDHCSVDGYPRPTTPALEALARRGVLFRNAWSPACWTAPAHASLFTGLRPEHHGLLLGNRTFLDPAAITLAEILAARGYRTGGFSCNVIVSQEFGLDQGFEALLTPPDEQRGTAPGCHWAHVPAEEWAAAAVRAGQPFFLFVNDMEPHLPYWPKEPAFSRFVPVDSDPAVVDECRALQGGRSTLEYDLGLTPRGPDYLRILSDLYDAEIATLDSEIGAFVRRLEKAGAMANTVLLILGDHGENLGDHGRLEHMFSLNRSVLHVPLLVVAPDRLPAGRIRDDPVRLEDVLPTILELCGFPVPAGLDGESLLGPLTGRICRAIEGRFVPDALIPDRPDLWDSPVFMPMRSVYDGRWHLVVRDDGRTELYDVPEDPAEEQDLRSSRPEEVDRLRRLLPRPPR